MNLTETQKIIEISNFPPDFKRRLLGILPALERNTLTGLGNEMVKQGSPSIAEQIAADWELFAEVLGGFKHQIMGIRTRFFPLLAEMQKSFNEDRRLRFLSLVLDVRHLNYKSKVTLSADELASVIKYEASFLRYLPKEEIAFLLNEQLLPALQSVNVLGEIQVAAFDRYWDADPGIFRYFSESLLNNGEILYQKTLGSWVQQFIAFSQISVSELSLIQVSSFMVQSVPVKNIPEAGKSLLVNILKLFIWLLHPLLDEDSVERYKQQASDARMETIEAALLKDVPDYRRWYSENLGSSSDFTREPGGSAVNVIKKSIAYQNLEDGTSKPAQRVDGFNDLRSPPVPPKPPGPAAAPKPAAENLDNQKPRLSQGNLAGSNVVLEESGLSSIDSIPKVGNLSSGGGAGNRTPRVLDDKPDSGPRHPYPETLYHKQTEPLAIAPEEEVRQATNIQDVLSRRRSMPEAVNQTQNGGLAGKDQKAVLSTPGLSFANPGLSDIVDIKALEAAAKKKRTEEEARVERKLEELKKRLKQD